MKKFEKYFEEVGAELVAELNDIKVEDEVYNLAHELCNKAIKKLEQKYKIVDIDGEECTEESRDGSMWYDDFRDDFVKGFFEKLSDWYKEQELY